MQLAISITQFDICSFAVRNQHNTVCSKVYVVGNLRFALCSRKLSIYSKQVAHGISNKMYSLSNMQLSICNQHQVIINKQYLIIVQYANQYVFESMHLVVCNQQNAVSNQQYTICYLHFAVGKQQNVIGNYNYLSNFSYELFSEQLAVTLIQ